MDSLDTILNKEDSKFILENDDYIEENKKRVLSVKKMLKNYKKSSKTNYRLLLNHIIIIQNDIGVKKTVLALRSVMSNTQELAYLNAFLYFLRYIEYNENENFCYDLYKSLVKETNNAF